MDKIGAKLKSVFDNLKDQIEQVSTREIFEVEGKQYDVHKKLASGAFADVFKVKYGSKEYVAKKQLLNENTQSVVKREIEIMKQLSHRNLVQFLGASKVPETSHVVIIMEFCSGGSLFDLLAKRRPRGPLTERGVVKIFADCVAAISYMHQLGLAHWDIKLENILQSKDNSFKLCDFGSVTKCPQPCATHDEWSMLEDRIGRLTSESYRAPEMCDNFDVTELDVKTDIWALGSILYALCFFNLPFANQGRLGIINVKYTIPSSHKFSPGLIKTIHRCFKRRPQNRADAAEVSDCYFFTH